MRKPGFLSFPSVGEVLRMEWPLSFLVSTVLLMTPGCTRKVYVPVERMEIRQDSLRSVREASDSVVVRDSVVIVVRGDSVLERRVSERTRVVLCHDTVIRRLADTVRVEVPVSVTEPAKAGLKPKRIPWLWTVTLVGALAFFFLIWRRGSKRYSYDKKEKL